MSKKRAANEINSPSKIPRKSNSPTPVASHCTTERLLSDNRNDQEQHVQNKERHDQMTDDQSETNEEVSESGDSDSTEIAEILTPSKELTLPEMKGLVPIIRSQYLQAHQICVEAVKNKDREMILKQTQFMMDSNLTIRNLLSAFSSFRLDAGLRAPLLQIKPSNQVVTQLIINSKEPGKKATEYVNPYFIANLDGHRDIVTVGTSLVGFFENNQKAMNAKAQIMGSMEEKDRDKVDFEIFAHSKFIMRSSYFPAAKLTECYGDSVNKERPSEKIVNEGIKRDLLRTSSIFPKEMDIVAIKIVEGRNDMARMDIMVTIRPFDKAKVHPKQGGIKVHVNFEKEFKITLFNQYIPKICNKCFKTGHTKSSCQQPLSYCGTCGRFHPGENCSKETYECPVCREEDNLIQAHKPFSFKCPHYAKLSKELQLMHYESQNGFLSLMELEENS